MVQCRPPLWSDATDGDLVLLRPPYRAYVLEPLDADPIREAHHHRLAIEQCVPPPVPPIGVPRIGVPRPGGPLPLHVGGSRPATATRRPVAVRPLAGGPRRRPSASVGATARVSWRYSQLTTVTANSSSSGPARIPLPCPLWSILHDQSYTATGSSGKTIRRQRRRGSIEQRMTFRRSCVTLYP